MTFGTFLLVIGINTLVSLVYLFFVLHRDKRIGIMKFVTMLLCPVLGPCFFLISYLFYKAFFSKEVDLAAVLFSKERTESFFHAEEERERNVVSLEEAIEITNEKDLRTLMLNIVRGDIKNHLASISMALNSEDTETAHYAASVLQSTLNGFRAEVEKKHRFYTEEEPETLPQLEELLEYMNQVLEQKVFSDMEQEHYVSVMDELTELLYQNAGARITGEILESVILRLLEVKKFDRGENWCERARVMYPNELFMFSCRLKLYYTSGNKEMFFETINELKGSPVVLDHETLELIRVFR